LSVFRGGVGGKGRVGDVREGEGSLVPLWSNDKGGLEFDVGEGAAKRPEVLEGGGEEKTVQIFDIFV
jgi:hypothetical protein